MNALPRKGTLVNDQRLRDLYSEIQNAMVVVGEQDFMSAPQLVVAGAQSSGKTTYIESLVGFRVGKTHRKTGTRCPVRYVLRCGEESLYSVRISSERPSQACSIQPIGDAGGPAGSGLLEQRELLRQAVEEKMDKHCGDGFKVDPIIVEITDPSVVDIDIVDLPGLKAVGDSGSAQISAIVSEYMNNPNVIPIVVSMAGKTEENSLDMDVLQQNKLDLSRSLLVVNGVNKQLKDCFRVSEVNHFMSGFKKKFKSCRDVKFVMLHHDITGPGIDKDHMSQEEIEDYYRTLPEQEQQSFEEHLKSLEQDAEVDSDLRQSFGLERTHGTMKDILLDWTRNHGQDALTRIQQKTREMRTSRDKMKQQITFREGREAELRITFKQYGVNWLSTMKSIRIGKLLRAASAVPGQFNAQYTFKTDNNCLHDYAWEVDEFGDYNEDANWMAPAKLEHTLMHTYTGESLKKPLSCNAAIARFLRVAGVVVMSHPMTEATDAEIENMSFDHAGNAGMTRSVNPTAIVKGIVDRELSKLFPDIFDRVLHHIRELCMLPMKHAHDLLCDLSYHEMKSCAKIQGKLNDEFENWLETSLKQCSHALQLMLHEKLATISVDVDNRFINLLVMAPGRCRDVEIIHESEAELQRASLGQGLHAIPCDGEESPEVCQAGTGLMKQYQRDARNSVQKVRGVMQTLNVRPVDFVEAGEAHIPGFEWRRIDVKEVNKFAEKYFHFYKGIIQMEMEAKVELYITTALQHQNGGHDDLHQRIGVICEHAFEDPDVRDAIVKDLDTADLKLQRVDTGEKITLLTAILEKLRMNLGLSTSKL